MKQVMKLSFLMLILVTYTGFSLRKLNYTAGTQSAFAKTIEFRYPNLNEFVPVTTQVDLTIEGNYAFVLSLTGFIIVDISNVENPEIISEVSSLSVNDLSRIVVSEQRVYLLESTNRMQIFDCTNPSLPQNVTTVESHLHFEIVDFYISSNSKLFFLVRNESTTDYYLERFALEGSNVVFEGYGILPNQTTNQKVSHMKSFTVREDYCFVNQYDSFQIVNISLITNPLLISEVLLDEPEISQQLTTLGQRTLAFSGNYLFLCYDINHIEAFNIVNRSSPIKTSTLETTKAINDFVVVEGSVVVASYRTLYVYGFNALTGFTISGSLAFETYTADDVLKLKSVKYSNSVLYLSCDYSRFRRFIITVKFDNPSFPELLFPQQEDLTASPGNLGWVVLLLVGVTSTVIIIAVFIRRAKASASQKERYQY